MNHIYLNKMIKKEKKNYVFYRSLKKAKGEKSLIQKPSENMYASSYRYANSFSYLNEEKGKQKIIEEKANR